MPSLWTRSYFAASTGNVSSKVIEAYIAAQKGLQAVALKTFQYRLYPSPSQDKNLSLILDVARHFYNMCLEERKLAWEFDQQSVSKTEQLRHVKHYKATFRQADQAHSHILQVAAADLDNAFAAFFRRVKAGETPGYPRFKGQGRFNSFGFKEYGNGFRLDGRRLKIFGAGRIPVRWHRPLEGEIKTVRIIRKAGRWYACFACEVPDPMPLPKTGRLVGLDMGTSALITTSDGDKVDNSKHYRAGQAKLRILQRSVQRKQKGSRNWRKAKQRVARHHEHMANQRADFLNKLIFELVNTFDGIAAENLRIRNMVRNRRLSKSILDSAWGYFKEHLRVKAANAGRQYVFVDPAYTSKTCSRCGAVWEHLSLSDRWVECACGLSLDRDHNAAINILKRAGWDTSVSVNVECS
jgi:putative transposase